MFQEKEMYSVMRRRQEFKLQLVARQQNPPKNKLKLELLTPACQRQIFPSNDIR